MSACHWSVNDSHFFAASGNRFYRILEDISFLVLFIVQQLQYILKYNPP